MLYTILSWEYSVFLIEEKWGLCIITCIVFPEIVTFYDSQRETTDCCLSSEWVNNYEGIQFLFSMFFLVLSSVLFHV